jgi:hypothetical protein
MFVLLRVANDDSQLNGACEELYKMYLTYKDCGSGGTWAHPNAIFLPTINVRENRKGNHWAHRTQDDDKQNTTQKTGGERGYFVCSRHEYS